MATIHEHVPLNPDNKLGFITDDGDIFGYMEHTGQEEYVGRVDYEEGLVCMLDEDEEEDTEIVLGWIDEDANIIASFENGDVIIGYVKENGDLHYYIDENDAPYVGKVSDMRDPVEGAAALLIFFEFEDEDE